MTTNNNIADIFNNIGSMLEILGDNPFKIRAYKKASATIKALDQDLNDISDIVWIYVNDQICFPFNSTNFYLKYLH